MTSPMPRLANLATTACLALAIIVGVVDSDQLAAFASVTPAVGTLA